MKFKVRDGFVAIIRTPLHNDPEDVEKVTGFDEQRFAGGKTLDLDADGAREHSHKLEPLDKEAAKFLEGLTAPVSGPAGVPDGLAETIAAAIAQAVSAGIAAAAKQAAAK